MSGSPWRKSRRSHAAILVLVSVMAVVILWQPATTALHTLAFTGQMLPGPLKIQRWLAPEPERMRTTFLRDDGALDVADIYVVPRDEPGAAVLMFLGATPYGLDDPEAVKLGYALARTGFVVMLYWSEIMGSEARLAVDDVPRVVAAFEHLSQRPNVDPERLGLAGFSVGASYAMVAAADPRISDDIAFINAFGGYYDASGLLAQIAARRTMDGTAGTRWEVHELAEEVFTNTLLASARSDAGDTLVFGTNSVAEAQFIFDTLPGGFRSDVYSVSPSSYVRDWNSATVFRVMHDRGDTIIPVGESRRLVDALRRERPDIEVRYTETGIFQHTHPDAGSGWWSLITGAWQVFRHMYHIIDVAR